MSLPQRPRNLYKWTCPHCLFTFVVRDYVHCQREARWHSWDVHRAATAGVPVPCLYDLRIQGRRVLVLMPDGSMA